MLDRPTSEQEPMDAMPIRLPTADTSVTGDESWLLQRLRAGDQEAFCALYERHSRRVWRLAQRVVGEDADDLCQQVFWQFYRRPPAAGTPLAPWLARVTINLGRNMLRSARRRGHYRERLGVETGGNGWLGASPEPGKVAESRSEQRIVRRVLGELPKRQATLLLLRFSGYRYREIAEALGLATGSIGTLLARAERAFTRRYESLVEGGDG